MDKIAKLKSTAKVLAAEGFLSPGAGVLAHKQILNNKNSARTSKGWVTRNRNVITKEAEDSVADKTQEARLTIRTFGHNINHPGQAASYYLKRKLFRKARNLLHTDTSDKAKVIDVRK